MESRSDRQGHKNHGHRKVTDGVTGTYRHIIFNDRGRDSGVRGLPPKVPFEIIRTDGYTVVPRTAWSDWSSGNAFRTPAAPHLPTCTIHRVAIHLRAGV